MLSSGGGGGSLQRSAPTAECKLCFLRGGDFKRTVHTTEFVGCLRREGGRGLHTYTRYILYVHAYLHACSLTVVKTSGVNVHTRLEGDFL